MTTIFEQLGLADDASAEEIQQRLCRAIDADEELCGACNGPDDCDRPENCWLHGFLSAIEQRGHEAGKRETWRKMCPESSLCCHNNECEETFETCVWLKERLSTAPGKGGE